MADYQHHDLKNEEPYAPSPVKIEEIEQPVESTDRGLFDFLGKKKDDEGENKCQDHHAISSEFDDKLQISEEPKHEYHHEEPKHEYHHEEPKHEFHHEEPKHEFHHEEPKFHHEEPKHEVCEEPKEEEKKHESLLEKLHRSSSSSSSSSDEEEVEEGGEKKKKKKGGLKDKIKGKITGDKKEEAPENKYEETSVPVEKFDEIPPPESEEKKGFLDKIKEKLPGGKKPEEGYAAAPPPHKEEVAEYTTGTEAEGKEKKGFLDKIKEKLPGYHPKGEEDKKEKGEEACH